MAKTQDLKRRIRSVKNTRQLTRAMKMVSASKLRRAQDRILAARPYANRTVEVLKSLASRANPEGNPLLQTREEKRIEAVVVTADKGLCGAFNSNILRIAQRFAVEHAEQDLVFSAVGRRSREFLARRYDLRQSWEDVFRTVDFSVAKEIAGTLMERYVEGKVDAVYLIYNEFKSAIQANPVTRRVLPIESDDIEDGQGSEDYIYEPSAQDLLDYLLPHYVETTVYHAMLESAAAEHAARMAAMDAATNNAGELIEALTLTMNRVRQASITTEIIEVVSGAEALG